VETKHAILLATLNLAALKPSSDFRPFLTFLRRFEKFVELSQAVLLVSLTEKT